MNLEFAFPGLAGAPYRVTSPSDRHYNCIAWALEIKDKWYWPGEGDNIVWPTTVPFEETVEAFIALFDGFGFAPCADDGLEPGFERIALFADSADFPTHAARQLPNGRWTSKLGKSEDIEHDLRALEGDVYGRVVRLFRRPIP